MCEVVLIINDNDSHLQDMGATLEQRLGYQVIKARGKEDALSLLIGGSQPHPDLVLVDVSDPDGLGLELLQSLRMCKPQLPVIMLVTYGNDKMMEQAFGLGVSDILVKPFWLEQLRLSMSNVFSIQRMTQYISYLERKHDGHVSINDVLGDSEAMIYARSQAAQAITKDTPVWVSGENGTGRELLAAAIHGESPRAGKPLVIVDCLKLEENAQQVLWGDSKAHGKLQEACGGTIILKNISALDRETLDRLQQVISASALPDKSVQETPRFIFIHTEAEDATDPARFPVVSELKLLCGTVISLPPLRERRGDIAMLANYFARRYAASENKRIRSITEAALEHMTHQPWPGNVRELKHLIWRAVLLSAHEAIEAGDIRLIQQLQPVHYENRQDSIASRTNPLLLDMKGNMKNLESIEKEVIEFALTYSGGCMTHAARNLGIGRSTLYRRMHALKLDNHISRENQMTRPTMRMSSKEHS